MKLAILVYRQWVPAKITGQEGHYKYYNANCTIPDDGRLVRRVEIEEGKAFVFKKDPSLASGQPLEIHIINYLEY